MKTSSLFQKDPSAVTLVAGDLEAVFLPRYGMLGASLRHRHVEILRRVQDLEVAAAKGSTEKRSTGTSGYLARSIRGYAGETHTICAAPRTTAGSLTRANRFTSCRFNFLIEIGSGN